MNKNIENYECDGQLSINDLKKYGVIITIFVADEEKKNDSLGICIDMSQEQIDKVKNLITDIYKENGGGYTN